MGQAVAGGNDISEFAAVFIEAMFRHIVAQAAQIIIYVVCGTLQRFRSCHRMTGAFERLYMPANTVDGNLFPEEILRRHGRFIFFFVPLHTNPFPSGPI